MRQEKRLTGRHIVLMLIAFFGIMIIANTAFVIVAVKSFPGESQKKSYLQGLNYNETLTARAKQKSLGWRAEITRIEATHLEVKLHDKNDAPVNGLTITGQLRRPSHDGSDQTLAFKEINPGVYATPTSALGVGTWDFTATAIGPGDEHFEFGARVNIQ